MAFFGDLGKFFNITTPEAAQIGSAFATGNIAGGIGSTIKAVATPIPEGESRPADVSGPPAGVDSPQTIAPISQTGMDGMTLRIPPTAQGFGQPQMAGAAVFGLPGLVQGAGRLLAKPGVGGLIGGIGAGAVVDTVVDMFGNQKKLVITRKLQRDVKKVFMLSGGNMSFVSANSMRLFGKSLSEQQILAILFKTFKNQGPFVTKAAVRKTTATIRKMETLCDLKDRLCPPKTTRRRTPARKSSTMITQVK